MPNYLAAICPLKWELEKKNVRGTRRCCSLIVSIIRAVNRRLVTKKVALSATLRPWLNHIVSRKDGVVCSVTSSYITRHSSQNQTISWPLEATVQQRFQIVKVAAFAWHVARPISANDCSSWSFSLEVAGIIQPSRNKKYFGEKYQNNTKLWSIQHAIRPNSSRTTKRLNSSFGLLRLFDDIPTAEQLLHFP